jgi:hypothetical protein
MMVQDPITGEWVDVGIPESNPITGTPRVDPAMPSPVDASNGGGPLGTDANPMVATIARQPKPPIEIVQSGQKVTPSKAENEATARLGVANSLVQQATNNETGVLQEEAQKVTIPLADQKLAALQKEQAKLKELDERDEREAAEVKAQAKALAEDKAKKQIAAGRARADYFKGNFVGNIVAALVQSVAAGLHARASDSEREVWCQLHTADSRPRGMKQDGFRRRVVPGSVRRYFRRTVPGSARSPLQRQRQRWRPI